MTAASLARVARQIALPIHVHPTSIVVVDVRLRAAVVMALARLLLEAAATSGRSDRGRDEPRASAERDGRTAVVYVRQSTGVQVKGNLEGPATAVRACRSRSRGRLSRGPAGALRVPPGQLDAWTRAVHHFSATRPDIAIGREILLAVQPHPAVVAARSSASRAFVRASSSATRCSVRPRTCCTRRRNLVKYMKAVFVAPIFCLILGCSSTSSVDGEGGGADGGGASSSGGGYSLLNCPGGLGFPPACGACIQSMCSTALDAVNNACVTTFQCVCQVGRDASACGTAPAFCNPAFASLMMACTGCTSVCAPADASID
jgi:hypothetical protein